MLGIERIQYIQTRVENDATVKVDELAQLLQVSPITIRRDLKSLEEQGKLTRIYGGAVRPDIRTMNYEERYDDKMVHEQGAKSAMARQCVTLIPNGATVLLDSGTSTFEVARLLRPEQNLTVVTYDIAIATKLCQSNIHTSVAGGELQNSTGTLFGPAAENFIGQVCVDVGIIGVAGISSEGVLFTPTMSKARLKQYAMHSARTCILLADAGKFNVSSLWRICTLVEFDCIITNAEFSTAEWEERGVDLQKVKVLTVKDKESKT